VRIKGIQLSWFRGAAESVSVDLSTKSMVVYGENGSGKSSFVDAVEFILNHGKIGHLAHEYSGKHQERGVSNTHRPPGAKTAIRVSFKEGTDLDLTVAEDGSVTSSGGAAAAVGTWDYRRTVLRQDEVSAFIHDTKGQKYSALLPLLGLGPMETAAENLRQLAKAIEQKAKLREARASLGESAAKRKAFFGTMADVEIVKKVADLHGTYRPDRAGTGDSILHCQEVQAAIETRLGLFSVDQKEHLALRDIAGLDLRADVESVRAAALRLASSAEPLAAEKLAILQAANALAQKLDDGEVECPACGSKVATRMFQDHVRDERDRLQEIIKSFDAWKAATGTLCDTLRSLKTEVGKPETKAWKERVSGEGLAAGFGYLAELNIESLRGKCTQDDLNAIELGLLPLTARATLDSKNAPADVQVLSADKKTAEAAEFVFAMTARASAATRAESLVSFVAALEHGTREEIRARSQSVISAISGDIQAMWDILHPGEAIEDVCLCVPKDADKAIDISLKFHGVKQNSPRLTLSEGNRNSLGLCIFLAMAKREAETDRPVFLDDVVVSMDRHHRGMIVEVLQKVFSGRQVVIFTHDRDWYAELRYLLDDKSWSFKSLLPFETPLIGIRWSHKTTTFDDARALLKERPDAAGNDARKIMDVEMMPVAERLQIRVPFLRGDKNDKRLLHDLLERVISEGKKCFQKKSGAAYEPHKEAISLFEDADALLLAWANRASHTFDLVRPEAVKLIDACEKALQMFRCKTCGKYVWYLEARDAEVLQCECSEIRWRYGKG
jgi:energy-coupling factor transporter ATP-binding protein EcfA2